MRRIIIYIFTVLFLTVQSVSAESISKVIRSMNINPSSVSVSVRNMKDGKVVYSWHDKSPMTPASTQKLVTTMSSLDTLGIDYKFSTKLYKSSNNDLYIKLGADPFFSAYDLETLFEVAVSKKIIEPKKIYIDDTVFDGVEWGEGWQWDDELNPLMQKYSAYNIDKNLLNIIISPKSSIDYPNISIKPYYPINVMNMVKTDLKYGGNAITIEKNTLYAPNVVSVSGVVSSQTVLNMPVPSPRVYFKMRIDDAVRKNKIIYNSAYPRKILPKENIYLVKEITHNLSDAIVLILKESDNYVSETLYKLAGGNYSNSTGSILNSQKMLENYLSKNNLISDDVKFVDGSGVSKNNIMTADFMTNFLVKIADDKNFEFFRNNLPIPGEGTLKTRMLYFKDNLRAKTGTLSDTSAIAGYITTKKGKIYAFDIMIKDAKTSSKDKKNIEEQILRQIYMN